MCARRAGSLPEMRFHKPSGQARVRVNGRAIYLGRWGSPQAQARYDALIAAYIASGRKSIEGAVRIIQAPATPPAGLTVAELVEMWLESIRVARPEDYARSSLWHGAMAVTKVLLPVGGMAAADFGPRALQEARQRLLTTPYTRKVRNDEGKVEVRAFPRTRRNVNEIIGRVRQMFGWAVANELVPESKAYALGKVKDLSPGESTAIDNDRRGPVADSLVDATLPFLTPEVADFVRVCRLTGSRPSEICRMTLSQIHDRDKSVWRYVPVRHKTARKGKVRHIPIGPKAQAIIMAHAAGRPENDPVFTPRRSVPSRITKDGTLPIAPRRASGRVGVAFTSGVIRIAVARACEKAGLTQWTPYSLRYSRTLEVREKFGAEAAKATAGHSSEQQTAHYAPPAWAAAAEAALATG